MAHVSRVFRVSRVWLRPLLCRFPAAGPGPGPGPGPGSGLGPGLTWRLSSRHRGRVRSCTVDPNLEEEFVFADLTAAEVDPALEEKALLHQLSLASSAPPPAPPPASTPHKQLRSLERQLQVLRGGDMQEVEPAHIQFQDVDFPLDENLVASKTKKKKRAEFKGVHKIFGTPDIDEPVSDICCSGCGAVLHCTAVHTPGYVPSEKYKTLLQEGRLGGATCQRCHLLTHHQRALHLQVSRDEYRAVVQKLRPHRALVLLVVDLLDLPDSIVPDLPQLVGTNKHVVVIGNKIDLLPGDSPGFLRRIKDQLALYCQEAGFGSQVSDIHLISAKTGYGVEALISSLQRSWKYKGDVYLVGVANAGKSTLFNTLLMSDFCKSNASDIVHKATISPWPGTTLNLLKFPIVNPTPYRLFRRQERLKEAAKQTDVELSCDERRRLQGFRRQGYFVGHVGQTFQAGVRSTGGEIQFDPDSLAFGEDEDEDDGDKASTGVGRAAEELTLNDLKDAHWLYDTPGIMKEDDILDLLTEQEVKSVVPTRAIVPRTFVLKPGTTLFLGGVARLDFMQGLKSCWFSVVASCHVPVHITSVDKADGVYEKHAGHKLLGVPMGGSERMRQFPALVPQDVRLKGRGYLEAAADITLSSAGWVSVTAVEGDEILLKVHGPAAARFGVRTPPLLPHIVTLKGKRIRKTSVYKPMKIPTLVDAGLSARGPKRRQLNNRK